MAKRQINESEKAQVLEAQRSSDGSLRCFISGEIIDILNDEIDFDHLKPWSLDGPTDLFNIRVVKREHHKKKGTKSLYEIRDEFQLQKIKSERGAIKLQDILQLNGIVKKNTFWSEENSEITDGNFTIKVNVFQDDILSIPYFYAQVPVDWIENDDAEGLQPRVIDLKRLMSLRSHLINRPQLAPSIARLIQGRIKIFDGQHKLAAQILNGKPNIDLKIYISPQNESGAQSLFDALMRTNIDAHSTLKQVPFYTSTLLERLAVANADYLEEFKEDKPSEEHSEHGYVKFLQVEKKMTKAEALKMLLSAIKEASVTESALEPFIAEESKSASKPLTFDLLENIFAQTLYLYPSTAKFNTDKDYRDSESQNFKKVINILVNETAISEWTTIRKDKSYTNQQRKARRIWHKGSVLTWAPFLMSIFRLCLQLMTDEEGEKKLYRPEITPDQLEKIQLCINRLFSHPIWDDNDPDIDSLLSSAKKQSDLFSRKGLTSSYVLYGR